MKILQLPRRFVRHEWGGTETVVLETSKRLQRVGHDTEILSTTMLTNVLQETIDGVPVRRVPYFYPYWGLTKTARRQMDKKGGNLFSFHLWKTLLSYPDIGLLHLHTGKRMGGICRHVAAQRRIPYVISLHGGIMDVPESEARTWTEPTAGAFEWGKGLGWWVGARRVLDDAAAIICVGRNEQLQMQKQYPNARVLHLPNGVDSRKFSHGDGQKFRRRYSIPDDASVLLTIGRIDPQKNQLAVIQQMPALLQRYPALHYLCIGPVTNVDYCEQIRRDIHRLGITRYVTLIEGLAPGDPLLVDAYHAADLFILPSRHEPFGIVILEAWSAGLPVIASRVGGIPTFVTHDTDGLLVSVDSMEELQLAISRLLANPEYRERLARSGRQKAQSRYDWDIITGQLIDIYEAVRYDYFVR